MGKESFKPALSPLMLGLLLVVFSLSLGSRIDTLVLSRNARWLDVVLFAGNLACIALFLLELRKCSRPVLENGGREIR